MKTKSVRLELMMLRYDIQSKMILYGDYGRKVPLNDPLLKIMRHDLNEDDKDIQLKLLKEYLQTTT
jgi:hypothetical protein